jgi:hypothetical protein
MAKYVPFRIIQQYFYNKASAHDEMLMREWITEKRQHEQLYDALISLYHARYSIFRVKAYWPALIGLLHHLKQFDRRTWIPVIKLAILAVFMK